MEIIKNESNNEHIKNESLKRTTQMNSTNIQFD